MKALENFSEHTEEDSEEEEEDGDPKKRTQLLLFLWAIENHRMSKVSLSDPPDNDMFDYYAQKTRGKLDNKTSPVEENPKENEERTTRDGHPNSKSKSPSIPTRNRSRSSNRSISPSEHRNSKSDKRQSQEHRQESPERSPSVEVPD